MAIRLSSNCSNCNNLGADNMCSVHEVQVSGNYTCNQFSLKAELDNERQCTTCVRFETDSCAHPAKASEGMLCTSWAPAKVA